MLRSNSAKVLGILLLMTCAADAGTGSGVTVEGIMEKWRRKESLLQRLALEWEDNVTIPWDESRERIWRLEAKKRGQQPRETVPKDLHYKEAWNLKLNGSNWRIDANGKAFDAHRELIDSKETIVYRDGVLKTFMPAGSPRFPFGNVHKAGPENIPNVLNAKPVFLVYRPLSSKVIDPRHYLITGRTILVKGKACVLLENRTKAPEVWSLCLDPDLDFAVVQFKGQKNGVLFYEATFDYKKGGLGEWKAESWSITTLAGNAKITQTIASTCKNYGYSVDPKEFEFEFPANTWVRDFTTPSEYSDNKQYLVRPSGTKRFVTFADRGASYEDLLNSESGMAKTRKRNSFPAMVIGLVVAVALAFFARWYYRRQHLPSKD